MNYSSYCQFPGTTPLIVDKGLLFPSLSIRSPENRAKVCLIFYSEVVDHDELVLEDYLPIDDHISPSIIELPCHNFIVAYTSHDLDQRIVFCEVSLLENKLKLESRYEIEMPCPTSYVYLTIVSEGKVFVITRAIGWKPTGFWFDFETGEITTPFVLFPFTYSDAAGFHSHRDGGRPYISIRNEKDKTYFAVNDDHPRSYRNGISAGFIRVDGIYNLSGVKCAPLQAAEWKPEESLTSLYQRGQEGIPWIWDLRIYGDILKVAYSISGRPSNLFETKTDLPANSSHYVTTEYEKGILRSLIISPAGSALSSREMDYYGGITLHPLDKNISVFSSNVDPMTGSLINGGRHSLFQSRSLDCGNIYKEIVNGTSSPAFRPRYSSSNPEGHALIYLQGSYTHFTDFESRIEIFFYRAGDSCFSVNQFGHVDLEFNINAQDTLPPNLHGAIVELLSQSSSFFEWGSGKSTLMAIESKCERVVSVDNNIDLVEVLNSRTDHSQKSVELIPVLVGKIVPREWGFWRSEANLGLNTLEYASHFRGHASSELVLIDGRSRLLCFFEVLKNHKERTTVIWDDYADRNYYHVAEKYASIEKYIGRAAIFIIDSDFEISDEDYIFAMNDIR